MLKIILINQTNFAQQYIYNGDLKCVRLSRKVNLYLYFCHAVINIVIIKPRIVSHYRLVSQLVITSSHSPEEPLHYHIKYLNVNECNFI